MELYLLLFKKIMYCIRMMITNNKDCHGFVFVSDFRCKIKLKHESTTKLANKYEVMVINKQIDIIIIGYFHIMRKTKKYRYSFILLYLIFKII